MPDPTMLQIAARMLATTRSFWIGPVAAAASPSARWLTSGAHRAPLTNLTVMAIRLLGAGDNSGLSGRGGMNGL